MADWKSSCHPDILAVLAYWEERKRGRRMPSRDDIDPTELVKFLPYISLIDVVDDERRFVYRLVGTMEVEVRGYDPTGKSVGDAFFAASAEAAMANYQKVCDGRAPFYEQDAFQTVDRWINEANLFLPFSDDGETVNKIMVFSINRDLYER
ncbi:MAG TPA: PAS domain-containing protein [Dongiaceae bacterium]|nr:PAS domain-containing protein [Dongiaceae bacterium]